MVSSGAPNFSKATLTLREVFERSLLLKVLDSKVFPKSWCFFLGMTFFLFTCLSSLCFALSIDFLVMFDSGLWGILLAYSREASWGDFFFERLTSSGPGMIDFWLLLLGHRLQVILVGTFMYLDPSSKWIQSVFSAVDNLLRGLWVLVGLYGFPGKFRERPWDDFVAPTKKLPMGITFPRHPMIKYLRSRY